jgi:hypothetical protein
MAFTLIRGRYVVVGKSPDGDSIRFVPDNPGLLMLLRGPKPNLKPGDSVQLRLEAIDALETHYDQGLLKHQPLEIAEAAREALLTEVGITNVVWNEQRTRVESANDQTPGYILSRTFEQNRRPVSFAYAGAPGETERDGDDIFLDGTRLKKSVNYHLIAKGLAYPTYYTGLFASLRAEFDAATSAARAANVANSVWAKDATRSGVQLPPLQNLTETDAVLPKLFRRLSQYFREQTTLGDFVAFLKRDPDPCILIDGADPSDLHAFITVAGDRVSMTVDPERLMFLEKMP